MAQLKNMKLAMGAPEPLTPADVLDSFDCGEAALDDWLKRRALSNQLSGASRTFVVSDISRRVFGYHALAAGAVSHELATASVRRNMPDPVPVLVLARLAIDRQAQGLKLGAALLQDALNRATRVVRPHRKQEGRADLFALEKFDQTRDAFLRATQRIDINL